MNNRDLIQQLKEKKKLSKEEWVQLFSTYTKGDAEYAAEMGSKIALKRFGNKIFLRGIIEFSNYCKNDCYYCGIRCSNKNASRYRLSKEEILECCDLGYSCGYKTFVLQGGEDKSYTTEKLVDIIKSIKEKYKDIAITLSIGELKYEEYLALFQAGADRYLLRHETAGKEHYGKLHPKEMSWENRMNCLKELKEIGYQTGCGMMIGSPYQTYEDLARDMMFLGEFHPHMVGLGPFIPHKDTQFSKEKPGTLELTLFTLSLVRIMLPSVLLPATTALGTIHPKGREMGVLAGANVVMPNVSPTEVRSKYMLYDNKICVNDEAKQCIACMARRMENIGYEIAKTKGDYKEYD